MTHERWLALLVGAATVILTLILLAVLERAGAKVEVVCIDPAERENVRGILLGAIDKALSTQTEHLFEVWMKDASDQPRRASVGANNAVSAWVRARADTLKWNPPPCKQ